MIIEIALGIVLAVVILAFLPQILALGVVAVGLALLIIISVSVIALGINYPTLGIIGIFISAAVAARLWTGGEEISGPKENSDTENKGKHASGGWGDESCEKCGGSFNPLAMRRCQCPSKQHSTVSSQAKD